MNLEYRGSIHTGFRRDRFSRTSRFHESATRLVIEWLVISRGQADIDVKMITERVP